MIEPTLVVPVILLVLSLAGVAAGVTAIIRGAGRRP